MPLQSVFPDGISAPDGVAGHFVTAGNFVICRNRCNLVTWFNWPGERYDVVVIIQTNKIHSVNFRKDLVNLIPSVRQMFSGRSFSLVGISHQDGVIYRSMRFKIEPVPGW